MSYGLRKDFYNSKAWKTVRKNVWIKQQLLCARCYKPVYVDGISSWLPKDQRRTGIVQDCIPTARPLMIFVALPVIECSAIFLTFLCLSEV